MNDITSQTLQKISKEALDDIKKTLDDLSILVKDIVKTLQDANIISAHTGKIISASLQGLINLIRDVVYALLS
ncbi:hypothetical protein [Xenorhabdus sp. KJ12.1]|uniref:hypothetical protein n=1 Tax=Xenorhabdus sp. KJ12.1 TaxID=1851571 RepID=UPI000C044032|nr:hypothetical protein [Xenorhabdus sp. KJ12.1]PHM68819.1 hypothetical protein Xekj_03046 [Xenorhabdus sp. KJ12.1]